MMTKSFCTSLACFALFSAIVCAQASGQVSMPVVGFAPDSAGALWPLMGIARAAIVGSPLDLGFSILQSAVPPNHDYILATTAESDGPIWLQVRDGQTVVRTFDGLAKVDRIAISPTGSAAAFSSRSDGRIYTFINLSRSPSRLADFDASGLGPLTALAVADDAKTLLLGTSDGVNGSVFLLKSSQPPRLVSSTNHPSAIHFLVNSENAIIADDVANEILSMVDGQVSTIAKADDGILAPDTLGISTDNQKIFVGNSKAGSITTIEHLTMIGPPLSCNCSMRGLYPTNTDSVFRITDFSGGPVVLFDGSSPVSQILFVPVATQQ